MDGIVADIREFTLHDGPGIRTTVFLKGCPLRCVWCHNPEFISPRTQVLRTASGERTVGRVCTDEQLAALLSAQAEILRWNDGGVTFSGGEPLLQAYFLEAVLDRLIGLHVVLDTCGYASKAAFTRVAQRCQLLYFDLKLIDPAAHRRYAGADNRPILRNLKVAAVLGIPVVVRVPLVPGVTDTKSNLQAIARTVQDLPTLVRVDLLPYNRAAGGKYGPAGLEFHPPFDETKPVSADTAIFDNAGIPVTVSGPTVIRKPPTK
jgi:pyruvate formate lyase activating enzyme